MSLTNSNLDLTDIDSSDVDQLASRIENFYKGDSNQKSALSYQWEYNMLMLDGKQWLVYDGDRTTGGAWKELRVSRANEYIPRPVTNYMMDAYQTLKSYLIQNKPVSSIVPNTNEYKDKMAAKLAQLVADANWERLKEEENYEYAAANLICYGTVFKKDFWDNTTLMMAKVPRQAEQPVTDPATGQVLGYEMKDVVNPETGEVEMDELPLGDVNTTVIEPYRIAVDPLATGTHDARWIMEYSIQPIAWIKETYGKEDEGYTGLVEDVKPEPSLPSALARFFALKTSSGTRSLGQSFNAAGAANGGSNDMIENAAVVKEYYERPCQKYPRGRMIVVANNVCLYSGESPYSGTELGDWHPYSVCRWELVPGRFWGKSPLDDACEIQKHINSIDATIILTRKTMAIPQKLIPMSSGIAKGTWTGRPGLEVRYRDGTGNPPSVLPPSGVHDSVFAEREQRKTDLQTITGAIDILKGDRPPGVTAASALEMLFEVGTGKLRPALDRWKKFVESSQKKQLKLVAKKYQEPREGFIALLHSKNKELPKEAIDKFIGMDLYDNCNLIVEAGSNIPKLQSAQKAQLLQVASTGALQLENPENRIQFLQDLGISGYDTDVGPDVKRAEWENDLLDNVMNTPDNRPVVLSDEDHAKHKQIHLRRMQMPSFLDAAQEVQDAYMQHMQEHDEAIAQQKQQAMIEAAMTGQPPMPQQGPGEQQASTKPSGKGVPAEVNEQILAADIPKTS